MIKTNEKRMEDGEKNTEFQQIQNPFKNIKWIF